MDHLCVTVGIAATAAVRTDRIWSHGIVVRIVAVVVAMDVSKIGIAHHRTDTATAAAAVVHMIRYDAIVIGGILIVVRMLFIMMLVMVLRMLKVHGGGSILIVGRY